MWSYQNVKECEREANEWEKRQNTEDFAMRKRNIYAVTAAFCLFGATMGSSALAAGAGTKQLIGIGSASALEPDKIKTDEDVSKAAGDTEPETEKQNGWKVAIDPGHQGSWVDMSAQEPSAPGSSETKAKATTGTTGKFSGLNEYELNLDVALLLRDELENRGYDVVMTREDHDTAISNKERAELAAAEGADILVRIHANGSEDTSVNGALAMVPSQSNPYVGYMYDECYELGDAILKAYCESTGIADDGVQYYDNMSGINWSTIPVTILEMGFMSNQNDDLLMADENFQPVMAEGIANGIDDYFEGKIPVKKTEETAIQSDRKKSDTKNANATETAASSVNMDRIENELAEDLAVRAGAGENWSAAVVDLNTEDSCTVNNQSMQAASLIKLFIMGAVYDRYDSLTAAYGEAQIQSLLSDMITVSDNAAANTLTNYLGDGDDAAGRMEVNEYCASNSYESTTMGRMLLAPADNGDNLTSVSDCAEFLRKLYKNELPHAEKMLGFLKNQQRTHKIPAGLPEGVESANKTGELDTVENDAAIVFADTPYILCIMSENLSDVGTAQNNIAGISADMYNLIE